MLKLSDELVSDGKSADNFKYLRLNGQKPQI